MSPQKLLFCYHLPTRGRAGVKLGDCWYVSNVSIIFDAPCLFYTNCFVFCYTSWRFYAFSRTNLLTRCHSTSFLFSAIFMFQKSYTGNILGIGRNKRESSYFTRHETESKAETEGARGRPHHAMARATPRLRQAMVWPPGPPPDIALPPIYSPRRENPKGPNSFPENILQVAAVVDARSRGSKSSSQHPFGEENQHQRASSSPWLPPEWCVSSLPWTTGP
jgi:hypothetical protein